MNLDVFFKAKRIAVIGASREKNKVGAVIFRHLLDAKKIVYPVNPNAKSIFGKKCYSNIADLPEVELAVIAVPGEFVPSVLDECGKNGIRYAIIISAGFKEIGNVNLEQKLQDALKRNNISCIGPNCLGVFDAHTNLDVLFLPKARLSRPKKGGISFISQSGATGSAILDLASYSNYGFAKFVSYGNAANVDESDLLDYLSKDKQTKLICAYIEGVKDGKKFLKIAKECKKPIIIIKGATTKEGSIAAKSHTGALAGSADVYFGAFRQAGLVVADNLEDVFDLVKLFDLEKAAPKGNRVQIITNGGGFGILTADALSENNLQIAAPGPKLQKLKSIFPKTVVVSNPCDLLGDATSKRYELALSAAIKDNTNDAIAVVALPQTPLLDERFVSVVASAFKKSRKPLVVVVTGGSFAKKMKFSLESCGVPCFDFPERAVKALGAYVHWMKR